MTEDASRREAQNDESPLTIEWEGFSLTVPANVDQWDVDALEAMETGKAVTTLRSVLGSAVYDKLRVDFQKKNGRKFSVGDAKSLTKLLATTYGFTDEGES